MTKKEWTEPKPMCEKLQYLIGVPSQYIDNFDALNKGELREIRKLCSLRSLIIDKFTEINEQFRNYVQLADISITSRLVNDLAEMGIVIQNAHSLSRNIIELNELIDARIVKVALGFKGIPREWICEMFHMPNGDEIDGVRTAVRKYRQYKNFYPYQKYINWPFAETPEEKRSKNIFGNDQDLHEMLAEIHSNKRTQLMDFIGTAKDVVAVVDCENSDAQRLYDSLAFMKRFLRKIILVDDTHTNLMWDELVREYRNEGVRVEHDELPRLKEQKSLVDLRMVAKTCEEYYKNHVEHFILVTSDSDIWALISSLPDADIMVLAERCKSGDLLLEALTQNHIPFVFMEDITEESTLLMDRIMRREIENQMSRSYIDVRRIVTTAAQKLNLYLDKETIDLYTSETLGEVVPVEDIGKGRIIVVSE
jgi:uncharacterized LabA/DUF88 family protein